MLNWKFQQCEPAIEYTIEEAEIQRQEKWRVRFKEFVFPSDEHSKLRKHQITVTWKFNIQCSTVRCIVTADSGIINDVFIGEKFPKPLDENTVLFFFFSFFLFVC